MDKWSVLKVCLPYFLEPKSHLSFHTCRELQQELRVGSSDPKQRGEGFSARSSKAREDALRTFAETFATDLLIPGTPWDGKV